MNNIEQYKQWHDADGGRWFRGSSTRKHVEMLGVLIKEHNCQSILDFGCGKGHQYSIEKLHLTNFGGIKPSMYDPAVEQYEKLPEGNFDCVFDSDVLEHLEYEELDAALQTIHSKSNKVVYHGVANFLTHRQLEDGRDSHIIREDIEWWVEKVLPYASQYTYIHLDQRRNLPVRSAVLNNNKVIRIK